MHVVFDAIGIFFVMDRDPLLAHDGRGKKDALVSTVSHVLNLYFRDADFSRSPSRQGSKTCASMMVAYCFR